MRLEPREKERRMSNDSCSIAAAQIGLEKPIERRWGGLFRPSLAIGRPRSPTFALVRLSLALIHSDSVELAMDEME